MTEQQIGELALRIQGVCNDIGLLKDEVKRIDILERRTDRIFTVLIDDKETGSEGLVSQVRHANEESNSIAAALIKRLDVLERNEIKRITESTIMKRIGIGLVTLSVSTLVTVVANLFAGRL